MSLPSNARVLSMFAHEKIGLMLLIGTLGIAVYLLVHHLVASRVSGKKSDPIKSGGEHHHRT